MLIEKKSLISKTTPPASRIIAINSRRVDLSKPTPVRVLAACSSGKHIKNVTLELL